MARKVKAKSFTLRQDQLQYMKDRFDTPGEASRWVRECIDVRIKIELKEIERLVKHRFGEAGDVPPSDDGASSDTGVEALHNFRTSVETKFVQSLLHTRRNVHLPETDEP